jgi:hypothetical protein
MKFWVQRQAPSGAWADSIGFEAETIEEAIEYYRTSLYGMGERLVIRTDLEVKRVEIF